MPRTSASPFETFRISEPSFRDTFSLRTLLKMVLRFWLPFARPLGLPLFPFLKRLCTSGRDAQYPEPTWRHPLEAPEGVGPHHFCCWTGGHLYFGVFVPSHKRADNSGANFLLSQAKRQTALRRDDAVLL